jgi:hypothetical protein
MKKRVFVAVALVLGSATTGLAQETNDAPVPLLAAALELELEVTERLQFRAEMPVATQPIEELEVGFVYELWRRNRVVLGAGIDLSPADPRDVSLRFEGDMTPGKGVIRSELTVGVGHERGVVVGLAGGLAGSNWRGTLELGHDSRVPELRIQPGIARKLGPAWIGLGLVVPRAESSRPSFVLEAVFDF